MRNDAWSRYSAKTGPLTATCLDIVFACAKKIAPHASRSRSSNGSLMAVVSICASILKELIQTVRSVSLVKKFIQVKVSLSRRSK